MKNKSLFNIIVSGILSLLIISLSSSYLTSRFIPKTNAANTPIFDSTSHPSDNNASEFISWQHTVTSSPNRLLLVGVNADSAYFFDEIVTVRANGRQLTRIVSQGVESSGIPTVELYYLKNPDPGTNTIQVIAEFFPELTAGAVSFHNVDQNQTFGPTGGNYDSGINSGSSVTLSGTNTSQLIVETLATDGILSTIPGVKSGQTFLWRNYDPTTSVGSHNYGSYKLGGSPSTSVGWNFDYNGRWAEVAVAINPAPPTPTPTPTNTPTPTPTPTNNPTPTPTPTPTSTPTPTPTSTPPPTPTPIGPSSGNIQDLNYAISNSWPWIQTYGLDLRVDDGFSTLLPASTACGGGSFASGTEGSFASPGIIFSGDTNADFGQGSASSTNWVVGGLSYPEVFGNTSSLKTSAQNLIASASKAGISQISLDSVAGCFNPATDCNLPSPLPKGVYVTTGDIRFRRQFTTTFQANNAYIFISTNGTIYFENNARVTVPAGATVLFSAGRDIIIDPTVHAAANACPVPAGQLQGVYSANRHIIIQGNNGDCVSGPDTMLNIDGTLIVNAGKINGTFQNQRDLCGGNTQYPSISIKARPDFILNTPGFLTQQQTISHEEAP